MLLVILDCLILSLCIIIVTLFGYFVIEAFLEYLSVKSEYRSFLEYIKGGCEDV